MRAPSLALVLWLVTFATPALAGTDYYVSPAGNDANSGTSPGQAWQSINRLNLVSFSPGDRILLEGGARFRGNLVLDAGDRGTPADPLVVTTYGTGRATIEAGTGTAILIYNTAGVRISNLSLIGAGRSVNTGSGISAYNELGTRLRYLRIESVNARSFGRRGIEVGGATSGFIDVRVTFVATWDNSLDGIAFYGPAGAHQNVYVGYSQSFSNPGIDHADSTGNGIVLGGVDGGVIERCVATNNGGSAIGPHGPIGIWAYYANNITIQYNESYNNRTGGWADGGGFALDVGVTNSTVQYNYSHGNHGAGYLLAGGFDPADHANNIIRYNISQNDARRNGFGALEIWGKTRNSHYYNNTVFTEADASRRARVVYITNAYADGEYPVGVSFRNNILYATGGIANVEVLTTVLRGGSLRFEHNNYYSTTGSPRIVWGGTSYSSLSSWASATGQERRDGLLVGTAGDPLLAAPGSGPALNDASRLTSVTAYALTGSSPLIGAGLDPRSVGLSAERDFYDSLVPYNSRFDVGAHEWTPSTNPTPATEIVLYAGDATVLSGNWSFASDSTAAGGVKVSSADLGWSATSAPLASPAHYFEVPFTARAGTRYRVWLRMRARANSKYNDSVYVQFSGAVNSSGSAVYRIGTTSGLTVNLATCADCSLQNWGWQNRAYWLSDTGEVWFGTTGSQTLRVQTREDGVEIDQIVISPVQYVSTAPGPTTNDTTIVAKESEEPPAPNTPPTVSLSSPADGATFTAPATVTVSATASDADGRIARVEFFAGSTRIGSLTTAPYSFSWRDVPEGTYTLTAVAIDDAGASTTSAARRISVTAPSSPPPPSSAPEIVLYASDVTARVGAWSIAGDAAAAGGSKLAHADAGWSNTAAPAASPSHYFEMTFQAQANTRYRVWLRLRARDDSKWNDSVYVQFSGAVSASGSPIYRIGTTAGLTVNMASCGTCALQGWGWQNRAYWLSDTGEVWFATTGTHTIRVQTREEGVEIDQVVISPSRYLDGAPGPLTNDTTIVPKETTSPPPSAPAEVVIYAADVTSRFGQWSLMSDATAAGGQKLTTPDEGWSSTTAPLASPAHYIDVPFTAQANTRYRIWLRLRARGDSKWNDSLYVQFSDAVSSGGAPMYRIGTTNALTVNLATCGTCAIQGWGWQNRAYWLSDTGDVWFPTTGSRTLRIQVREDGVELDQIILSPAAYLTSPPGPTTNDGTIVAKPQ